MKKNQRQSHQARQGKGAGSLPSAPTLLPSWARYLARIQDEAFYFLHACSSRAAKTMERFASCRKYEDIVDAQAAFIGDLLSDFAEEGALLASRFCGQTMLATATDAGTNARTRKTP